MAQKQFQYGKAVLHDSAHAYNVLHSIVQYKNLAEDLNLLIQHFVPNHKIELFPKILSSMLTTNWSDMMCAHTSRKPVH